jgi:hypothetical protein
MSRCRRKIIDGASTAGPGVLGTIVNDRVAANRQLIVKAGLRLAFRRLTKIASLSSPV